MTDNLNEAGVNAAMAMLDAYGVKDEHARIAIRAYLAEVEKMPDQDLAGLVERFGAACRLEGFQIGKRGRASKWAEDDAVDARSALLARYEEMRMALERIANETEVHTKLNQVRLCCKFQDIARAALSQAKPEKVP